MDLSRRTDRTAFNIQRSAGAQLVTSCNSESAQGRLASASEGGAFLFQRFFIICHFCRLQPNFDRTCLYNLQCLSITLIYMSRQISYLFFSSNRCLLSSPSSKETRIMKSRAGLPTTKPGRIQLSGEKSSRISCLAAQDSCDPPSCRLPLGLSTAFRSVIRWLRNLRYQFPLVTIAFYILPEWMSGKGSYLPNLATQNDCPQLDRVLCTSFSSWDGQKRNARTWVHNVLWSDDTITRPNINFIATFDVLYILGPVCLVVILLTAWCSPNVRRPSTWFMAVGSWVVISVANILLLGHQTGPEPPHSLCLAQATLIYASPVFCAFSAAAFVLETYFAAIHFKLPCLCGIRTHIMLFYLIPCIISLFIFIEALTLGVLNTAMVERDASGLYCNLSSFIPRKVTGGSIMCGLLIVLIVEVLIVLAYRRTSLESTQWLDPEYVKSRPNISGDHVARVLAFTTCALIAFSASLIQYLPRVVPIDNGKISLVQATLPCCASLIFGTQRDILCVWIPARYRRKGNSDDISKNFLGS